MKKILLPLILTLLLLCLMSDAFAARGKVKSLAKRYRNIDRKIDRLTKRYKRLTPTQRASLLSALSDKYDDVDNDDLPDYLDEGSGRCDADSDDDGILDGEDFDDDDDDDDNSSPSPSPSSSPSGSEIEIHALIQSITETSITVNNTTFQLTNSTEYLDDDNNALSRTDFTVGECVEVEGYSSSGNATAEKVKEDDDC